MVPAISRRLPFRADASGASVVGIALYKNPAYVQNDSSNFVEVNAWNGCRLEWVPEIGGASHFEKIVTPFLASQADIRNAGGGDFPTNRTPQDVPNPWKLRVEVARLAESPLCRIRVLWLSAQSFAHWGHGLHDAFKLPLLSSYSYKDLHRKDGLLGQRP